ncbi:hypothetical protein DFP73DRAFT_144504 [Morchella snyderi]|nr:hypothetical protein DFP73DRAFT_144504 [Morchella snyderi]
MTEESQYQLWNTALDIVYLAGEEEGTWGSDPQREKKLSNWRAEMIYKHDLTIPPPISWNQKQLAVEPRPTNEERREYTKNFHTMYNNSYFWRVLDQAWDKGCLEKCLEANNAIWELKLKYRDFPWFCLPLPSEKWRTHTSQYIPKPSKNYCQWVIGLLDFGLMNFGDAEQIRITGFRPVEREGAFEDSCHRAWLANAEYLPEGATNPLDDSDEDSDATSRSDTPQVPEPELTPEPELEVVEHNYYNGPAESQDSDSENATTDESEAAEEDGEADQEDDEEAVEETRQVGFKSKRGAESLTNAGKRTRVGN